MKVWIWSALALSLLGVVGGTPARALACINDDDCACGDVCSWAAGFTKPHVCVAASGGDPGWCGANADCLYTGQTCVGTSCTPAWSDTSVCKTDIVDAGPDQDAGPADTDAGTGVDAGSDAGSSNDGGTTGDGGTDAGSDAGTDAGADAGEGTTGGTTTGGTTTGGITTGGTTTGGSTGASCTNDIDCDCGQVCSWAAPHDVNHICVSASTGDPGWCSGSPSDCLYAGQTCSGTSCTPAWSESSVCTKGGGSTTGGSTTGGGTTGGGTTGGGTGPTCNNDSDCSCGDVCSWANLTENCQANCGSCVSASSGDPGHCDNHSDDKACLYVGQTCSHYPNCFPAWTESSVCVSQAGGTTGGTTGGAGTTGGGSTGEGSTTGAPEGTTGGAATSGAGSGTTTGTDTGPSSGGGCSSVGGSFALVIGVLALGLLTRKRREA